MKIAYIIEWDMGYEDGVIKKVSGQMRSWRDDGHTVKLFALSKSRTTASCLHDLPKEIIFSPRVRYSVFNLLKLIDKVKTWKPDIVYLRSMMYYPSHEKLFSIPVFIEINTKEISEKKVNSKFWAFYTFITRGRLLRRSQGIVTVTSEIAQDIKWANRPTLILANGIDLKEIPELPPARNSRPRLVFIGSVNASWHGTDKIIWLAQYFNDWQFDIIGPAWKVYPTLPNVTFHGELKQSEYLQIMASADIALGTLSLHKKGMNEASPLKVREYLAYGIPTIIGYCDTDFPKPVHFLLQLPNTEMNVQQHTDRIKKFVYAWKGMRVTRSEIAHLDNAIKEKQRILFFMNVMGMKQNNPNYE